MENTAIRLPATLTSDLDEIAYATDCKRSEVIRDILEPGVRRKLRELAKLQDELDDVAV